MALITGTLAVPADLDTTLPCVQHADLYTHEALDADPYDEDFQNLDADAQRSQLEMKQIIETACIAHCAACPLLNACRDWSLTTQVHGVAGGLTQHQRDLATGRVTLTHRASQPAPSTNRSATGSSARKTLDPSRLTPETLAMYEYLAASHSAQPRENVLTAGAAHVPYETALRWGQHHNGTPEEQHAAGLRKFLLNRLDIAVRRGRITSARVDGHIMLALSPETYDALQPAA